MKNVLLLVPTETYRAQAFIDAANNLGLSLTIASECPLPMAQRMGERAIVASLQHPEVGAEQIESAGRTRKFDAIVSVDDSGLRTAAIASEKLGLKHISTSTTEMSQNKIAMRRKLSSAMISQPKFQICEYGEDIAEKLSAIGKFPVIVKPATLSGSIGVIRANSETEVLAAIPLARKIQAMHSCEIDFPILIEEYIDGEEYAVEAIVISGKLQVLAIFDKPQPLVGPYFAETIYVTPTSLPRQITEDLFTVLDAARKGLGIVTGPIHAEFRITAGRKIYFIELAARSIGGACSKAVPLAGGRTIEEIILAEAVSIPPPEVTFENQASGVYMIPAQKRGRLDGITGVAAARAVKWVTGIELAFTAGMEVMPIPYDAKYIGFIFSKAPTAKIAARALEEAINKLEIRIT